jgi:hypothetical protein
MSEKGCGIIIFVLIATILGIIGYKQTTTIEETNNTSYSSDTSDTSYSSNNIASKMKFVNIAEAFSQPPKEHFTTPIGYDPVQHVKSRIDARYNDIVTSQYKTIKSQQQLDELTDRMNKLNSELQKHVNTNLSYQASGDLTFY